MEIIDELEVSKRGIYAGAVGYLGFNGDMDLAIAIRTGVIKDGTAARAGGRRHRCRFRAAKRMDRDPEQGQGAAARGGDCGRWTGQQDRVEDDSRRLLVSHAIGRKLMQIHPLIVNDKGRYHSDGGFL